MVSELRVGDRVRIACQRSAHNGETGKVIEVDKPWIIVAFDDQRLGDVSAGFDADDLIAALESGPREGERGTDG